MSQTDNPVPEELKPILKRIGLFVNEIQLHNYFTRQEMKEIFTLILENDHPSINAEWVALFSAIQTRNNTLPTGSNEKERAREKEELNHKIHQETLGLLDAAKEFDPDLCLNNADKTVLDIGEPVYAITGSGKDTWKTFNISTTAAFIAAGAGVKVLKPGSHATSSVTGAIDALTPFGMSAFDDPADLEEALKECNIAVASFHNLLPKYAKRYDEVFYSFHPLSYIMPVAAIPFKLDGISFGIADTNVARSLDLIRELGIPNITVCSSVNAEHKITDEFVPHGERHLAVFRERAGLHYEKRWPVKDSDRNFQAIEQGQSHDENARKIVEALQGDRHNPLTKAACMSAAMVVYNAGKAKTIGEAYTMCIEATEKGKAMKAFEKYQAFCVRKQAVFDGPVDTLPEALFDETRRLAIGRGNGAAALGTS